MPTPGYPVHRLVRRLVYGTLIVLTVCVTLLAAVLGCIVYLLDSELMTKAEIKALAVRCPHDREVCLADTDIALLPDHVVDAFVAAMRPTPCTVHWTCVLLKPLARQTLMTHDVAEILIRRREHNGKSKNWRAEQGLTSVKIEYVLPQATITSLFLNNADFGEGQYGIAAASMKFLAKPPDELDVKEAAELATFLRESRGLMRHKDYRLFWRNRILNKMVEDGTLAPERAAALKEAPLAIKE